MTGVQQTLLSSNIIAHRGNIDGIEKNYENQPDYINNAINLGFDVEIDVWFIKDRLYLGHDEPQYEVNLKFLQNDKLWCHAKNIVALQYMLLHNVHCFWHQTDDVVLTSKGFMWTYPGKELTYNSICVMPETYCSLKKLPQCRGYCSDYPKKILEYMGE